MKPAPDEVGTFATGIAIRASVMGEGYVRAAFERTQGTESEDLQNFVTEHVWGALWSRPHLDHASRSLLNLGILTSLRAFEELSGHIRGALTNGLSRKQISEAILHTAGYCGAPAALAAMRVAQRVFDELDEGKTSEP